MDIPGHSLLGELAICALPEWYFILLMRRKESRFYSALFYPHDPDAHAARLFFQILIKRQRIFRDFLAIPTE